MVTEEVDQDYDKLEQAFHRGKLAERFNRKLDALFIFAFGWFAGLLAAACLTWHWLRH